MLKKVQKQTHVLTQCHCFLIFMILREFLMLTLKYKNSDDVITNIYKHMNIN